MFTPAPVVLPGDPFIFDPALCPSSAMLAVVVRPGVPYHGEIDAYDKDANVIIFTTSSRIVVDPNPISEIKDPNDPLGLCVKRTYKYIYTPPATEGIENENVGVKDKDSIGLNRTIVFLVKIPEPPVIVGCR